MATTTPRQLVINRVMCLSRHYDVVSPQGSHIYYVERSVYTPGKADLTLRHGADRTAPVVAVCYMPHLTGDVKIGLGDPNYADAMRWEDMVKQGLTASEYRWTMPDLASTTDCGRPTDEGKGRQPCLSFAWKRTHSVAADGASASAFSSRNYKLIDLQTGERAAVFTSHRTSTKCGVLQIDANHGPDFDMMVLATCVSLYEKAYRRSQRRSSS